ncbi:MAG: VCBS repeat-containing protein [Planctomycetota bacterium]
MSSARSPVLLPAAASLSLLAVLAPSARAAPPTPQAFGLPRPIASPVDATRAPVAFDLDLDGDLDIVGTDAAASDLWFLENLGGGAFAIARTLGVDLGGPGEPLALGAGDVDADGTPDLFVVLRTAASDFDLVRFSVPVPAVLVRVDTIDVPSTTEPGRGIRFLDRNGDGALDLEFTLPPTGGSGVSPTWVAYQRMGGAFEFAEVTEGLQPGSAAALVDLAGAPRPALVGKTAPGVLSLLPQSMPETFGPPLVIDPAAPGAHVETVRAKDLDGDGLRDLAVLYGGPFGIAVYRGTGGGAFAPRVRIPIDDPGARIELEDVDLDGLVDVVVLPDLAGEPLRWIENVGGLMFGPLRDLAGIPGTARLETAALVDLDGDARDDLLAHAPPSLYVVDGVPAAPGALPFADRVRDLIDRTPEHRFVRTADVDGDGDPDVVTGAPLSVALNRGPGRLERPAPLYDEDVDLFGVADLDGDGDDDVIGRRIAFVVWYRSDGTGALDPLTLGPMAAATRAAPLVIDALGDGDLDVAVVAEDGRRVRIFDQLAPSTFGPPRLAFGGSLVITDVAAADLDGDGMEDLAVARSEGAEARVEWYRQLADGSFAPPVTIAGALPDAAVRLIAADLDGSGSADLAWLTDAPAELVVASNAGGGDFSAPPVRIGLPGRARDVAPLPTAGTAGPDLLVAVDSSDPAAADAVLRLRWISGTSYEAPVTATDAVDAPETVAVADLDGDGDADFVTSQRLAWFRNRATEPIGDLICGGAVPNSTGRKGELSAFGSRDVGDDDVRLVANELPPGALTLFLTSRTGAFTPMFGGGVGLLCLSGDIGRFDLAGQFTFASADGRSELVLDLMSFPQPTGVVQVMAGDTWAFQAWHRDAVGGVATSNLTQGVALLFL